MFSLFSFSLLGKEIEFGKPSLYVGREETASPFVVVATCCENITTVDLNDDTQYLQEDDDEDGGGDQREEAKRGSLGTGDMGAVIRARDDTALSLHCSFPALFSRVRASGYQG